MDMDVVKVSPDRIEVKLTELGYLRAGQTVRSTGPGAGDQGLSDRQRPRCGWKGRASHACSTLPGTRGPGKPRPPARLLLHQAINRRHGRDRLTA